MTFIDYMFKSHNVTFSLARRLEIMQSANGWNLTTDFIESNEKGQPIQLSQPRRQKLDYFWGSTLKSKSKSKLCKANKML